MKGIGRTQQFLERKLAEASTGEDRLIVAIALVELGLCAEGAGKLLQRSGKLMADELQRSNSSRRRPYQPQSATPDRPAARPATAAPGLCCARRAPPPQLLNAIDRMMPMLRLFRHGDGALALFNGMGVTPPEQLATVLAYDDVRARALTNAPHSGYQRLEMQDAVVIADAGRRRRRFFDARAMRLRLVRVFGRCAALRRQLRRARPNRAPAQQEAARTTAAHSTLDRRRQILLPLRLPRAPAQLARRRNHLGARSRRCRARRRRLGGEPRRSSTMATSREFGLLHQRRLALRRDGRRLDGADRIRAAAGSIARRPVRAALPHASERTPEARARGSRRPLRAAERQAMAVRERMDRKYRGERLFRRARRPVRPRRKSSSRARPKRGSRSNGVLGTSRGGARLRLERRRKVAQCAKIRVALAQSRARCSGIGVERDVGHDRRAVGARR